MKARIGKLDARFGKNNADGSNEAVTVSFEGLEYEISVPEVIEFMITRFDLFVKFCKGALKFSKEARPEAKEWFTEVISALNIIKAEKAKE